MNIEKTTSLMVDHIRSEKYSPVAKFDNQGQLHQISGQVSDNPSLSGLDSADISNTSVPVSIKTVTEVVRPLNEGCQCENIGPQDEGSWRDNADPVKGGVSDIPASLGGWGSSIGNLLDVFG
ncbi:hypothetical protein JD969_16955 [Planctomycetota bacterium]|nr:hypothetical protein JD969_16955 [Planctomycetota bacterium]